MTTATLILLLLAIVAVLVLPRRWVPVPFLLVACYVPRSQVLNWGQAGLMPLRILTIAALLRVLARLEWRGLNPRVADYLMVAWGALMIGTVAFHEDPAGQVIGRLGLALDGLGLFLVVRFFCRSERDVTVLCLALAVLLVPLAGVMVYEKVSAHNVLAVFGAPDAPLIRDGRVRAQGPFRHPILAGTIGALSVPLVGALWPRYRIVTTLGIAASLVIVVTATSSGPLMSLAVATIALCLWRFRAYLSVMRWSGVAIYGLLTAAMTRPAYYLIGEINLTGSSTGWHRARLIESSLQHLDEWWLAGTDYTRHWMSTGVAWNADHSDLTNHYIALGVYGGLPLLLTFLAVIAVSFFHVGRRLALDAHLGQPSFVPWGVGASLFTLVVTSVSVSYFDQSLLWLYMTIAFCCVLNNEQSPVPIGAPAAGPVTASSHRARRRNRAQPSRVLAASGARLSETRMPGG